MVRGQGAAIPILTTPKRRNYYRKTLRRWGERAAGKTARFCQSSQPCSKPAAPGLMNRSSQARAAAVRIGRLFDRQLRLTEVIVLCRIERLTRSIVTVPDISKLFKFREARSRLVAKL